MAPERWQRIKELFASALECAPTERFGFLDEACAGDGALRREIERLLFSYEEDPNFMEAPAVSEVAAEISKADQRRRQIGRTINHYSLLQELGAGGMGEVYLAEDTRLGRKVAIKLLPDEFTRDEERLRRFEQEACAASTLNHPNILTIYEVGESDGTRFIVTEYVDGETLRRRMASAQITINEALDIAMQIASALAAAHDAGVVHRDIKPENIMLRYDQGVKVLDFGLAKLTEQAAQPQSRPSVKTSAGLIMGTVAYMSPEQTQDSEQVDHRTDIWSLGVVFYEMVAGHRPFEGKDLHRQIIAIQENDPPPLAMRIESVPERLKEIVQKALSKDPDQRYQAVKDLLIDLRDLKRKLEIAAEIERSLPPELRDSIGQPFGTRAAVIPLSYPMSSARHIVKKVGDRKRRAMIVSIALSIILAAVAFVWHRFAGQDYSASFANSMRTVPFTSFPGQKSGPAFSPDGNQIAFAWDGGAEDQPGIFVKLIGAWSPLRLTSNLDASPAWSPDGRYVAFIRSGNERGIYGVPALGGPERKLTNRAGHFAWSPDGRMLAVEASISPRAAPSIFLVTIETGEERRLTTTEAGSFGDTYPAFSPDGRTVAFIRSPNSQVSDIHLVPVTGGEPRRLTYDNLFLTSKLAWNADGREIIFSSSRGGLYSLWRVQVSGGPPRRVIGAGEDAISPAVSMRGGRLAYIYQKRDTNIWRAPGPNSKAKDKAPVKLISSTRKDDGMQFSPDGKHIVFTSDRSGNYEIWVAASDGQNPTQLTNFGGAHTGTPRWSPDGTRIAFDSRPEGYSSIYVIGLDGSNLRRATTGTSEDVLPSWSRDGKWIYFGSRRSGNWQIWKIPAEGGEAVQLTRNGGDEAFESWDGQYAYYTKHHETGVWRVPTSGGEESRIFDGGQMGHWALLEEGICFLDREAAPQPAIGYFNFSARRVTPLIRLEKSKAPGGASVLDVSRDGRWIIYWQWDQLDSDIILVENFR
jgi:serine/threonine protein kinase/Tol biopolymer transport system component